MNEQEADAAPSIHYDSGRSIIIRHTVKPGHRDHYETWLRQIIAAAAQFSGHQGVHVVRPPEGHDTFEIAVRFSQPEEADTWLNSDVRRELVSDIVPALASEEQVEIQTGIDYWFTPPTSKAKQPTRWKQWLITTAVIWPLTLIVPMVFQPIFDQLPVLAVWGVRHGLVAAAIVALVVYLIMPRVVRLVANWLFR
ncbi:MULTISPECIES: antibiotic biosynthesis monooxygenase [Marinobacter]|uniref:antibiotic biosynthesis monooxygenase n=1 Tax=Marinobacter TaxID=2742 RepID=UPI0029433476|nr:antibiotic biosynthesis monooxygenase [Marinobacter salarius]WOI17976.1 antibiotic biosynthesis monooxygenase [Marinobacter salarius]